MSVRASSCSTSITKSVAVIGAGGAGLAIAKRMTAENCIDLTVYEKNNWVGGIWRYTKSNKDVIDTPMYRDLRTNLPKHLMAYPDFPYPTHLPSFISAGDVEKYLEDYAHHFDLMKHIKLNHEVISVKPHSGHNSNKKLTWNLAVKDVQSSVVQDIFYDAIVVCNGHFHAPIIPEIPGLNIFPGTVIHSKDYDKPEDFKDQVVVILGSGNSGNDICVCLSKFVKKMYLIHKKEKFCNYPENVEEIKGTIKKCFPNGEIEIDDGRRLNSDAIILCTGYRYFFPFLDKDCGIQVTDNHVSPLYKHVFNIVHPSMSFMGICQKTCPFLSFAMEAEWIVSVLIGSTSLPSKKEMLDEEDANYQKFLKAGFSQRHFHYLGSNILEYFQSLAGLSGADCSLTPVLYSLYSALIPNRSSNLTTYKNKNFVVDGDQWYEV